MHIRARKLSLLATLLIVGLSILLVLFWANIAVLQRLIFYSKAEQNCMTPQQISSDSRCLYILSGKIYSMGSRSKPHKGHSCGNDITSVIPGFHKSSASTYLIPYYVADVCTAPSPTPTPTPTRVPTPTVVPTSTPTRTPTPTLIPSPTFTPTATPTVRPTSTSAPKSTNTPVPTLVPTLKPSLTPIIPTSTVRPTPSTVVSTTAPGITILNFSLLLHGIGKAGDAARASYVSNDPIDAVRNIKVEVFNDSNVSVLILTGTVAYDKDSGSFVGSISVSNLQSGVYNLEIKIPQYLKVRIPDQIAITNGTVNQIPEVSLYAGDVNNDDLLSILDFNSIMDCFVNIFSPRACSDPMKKMRSDLNNDGKVNQVDYNLFLREFANLTTTSD